MATQTRFVAKNGLDNNSKTITSVADPVNAQDAATKNFSSNADNLTSGTVAAARIPSLDWSKITTGKPTTLAGYGITDGLLATSYTAADVLAKLKTVDGTGSGLDADTIDGVDSSALARITAGGLLAPVSGNLVLDCRDGAI